MDPAMVKNLALGAIPPAVMAAVFFALAWRRREAPVSAERMTVEGESSQTDIRLVLTPVVMLGALLATYLLVFGSINLSPVAAFDWLPFVAVAAAGAGVMASFERLPGVMRWAPAVGAILFAAWASAKNLIAGTWSVELSFAYLLESLLTGVVVLTAAHVVVSKRRAATPVVVLMLFVGAATQLLVLGFFSMKVGQLAGMSASMLMAAAAVAFWRRDFRLGAGGMTFVVVMTLATFTQGRLYGEVAPEIARVYSVLVVLAVIGAALATVGLPLRMGSRARGAVIVTIAAVPLLIGLGVAGKKWAEADKAASEDPYGYDLGE